MSREVNLFISYSHNDEAWHDRLVAFLDSLKFTRLSLQDLKRGNLYRDARFHYRAWSDRKIELGAKWEYEINDAIDQARVAILLISTDFLASEFVLEREIPRLMDRSEQGELAIFPLVVRPCLWKETNWLAEIQMFSTDRALSELAEHEFENRLTEFSLRIDEQLDSEISLGEVEEAEEAPEPLIERDTPNYPEPLRERSPYGLEFLTWSGVRKTIDESGLVADGEHVIDGLLLFRTKAQRTWLAVTHKQLFCVLDGEKTRSRGRLIQWRDRLDQPIPVHARDRAGSRTGLLNVGSHSNWLYSKRLHPLAAALEQRVTRMIEAAR
jgi:hypothetical protein